MIKAFSIKSFTRNSNKIKSKAISPYYTPILTGLSTNTIYNPKRFFSSEQEQQEKNEQQNPQETKNPNEYGQRKAPIHPGQGYKYKDVEAEQGAIYNPYVFFQDFEDSPQDTQFSDKTVYEIAEPFRTDIPKLKPIQFISVPTWLALTYPTYLYIHPWAGFVPFSIACLSAVALARGYYYLKMQKQFSEVTISRIQVLNKSYFNIFMMLEPEKAIKCKVEGSSIIEIKKQEYEIPGFAGQEYLMIVQFMDENRLKFEPLMIPLFPYLLTRGIYINNVYLLRSILQGKVDDMEYYEQIEVPEEEKINQASMLNFNETYSQPENKK